MRAPTVGFAGMTHLGLVSAVAAASRGFATLGWDPDPNLAMRLSAGELPIVEPGLDDAVTNSRARLRFSADPAELSQCDLVYIAPDVPTDSHGRSDLSGIWALFDRVSAALSPSAILVILCQVPPGFTRALAFPLERLFYQVETLVFGRAVERALSPERLIVGCAEPGCALPPTFKAFLDGFSCPILPMRYESAELAKISINLCLIASISAANLLAELCEQVRADWGEIVPALRLDRRIGAHAYLTPGLGLAGGNLERDLASVLRLSEAHGTNAAVAAAWVQDSAYRKDWTLRMLHRTVLADSPDATIGILGLAYKENTDSIKNSAAVALIENLPGYRLQVYDPVVSAAALPHRVSASPSAIEAARGADAVLVMTPWPQLRDLQPTALAALMRGNILIDPYRVFSADAALAAGLLHFALGVPPRSAAEGFSV